MSAEIIDNKYIRVYVTISKYGYISANDYKPTSTLNYECYSHYYYDIPLPDEFVIQKGDGKYVKPVLMEA